MKLNSQAYLAVWIHIFMNVYRPQPTYKGNKEDLFIDSVYLEIIIFIYNNIYVEILYI